MSTSCPVNSSAAHAAAAPDGALAEENSKRRTRPAMAHSLRHALRAFYDANPNAELSRAQIAEKFFRSIKTVDIALAIMKHEGELVPVHAWRRPDSFKEGK